MNRREALETVAGGAAALVLAAAPLPAAPLVSTRTRYLHPDYPRPPDRYAWIGAERLGRLVSMTFYIVRDDPLSREGLVQGTMIVRDLDWELLAQVQPRHSRESTGFTMAADIPPNSLPPELAATPGAESILLQELHLHHEGWGWTEDDLTHEVAFTFSATLPAVTG